MNSTGKRIIQKTLDIAIILIMTMADLCFIGASLVSYAVNVAETSDKNVDFIVQRGLEKPIPIEVSCGDKDKSQIKRAIKKYNSSHGIIISNTTPNIVKNDNIICIPPEIFAFI